MPSTSSPLAISPVGELVVGYWDATGRGRITLLDSFSALVSKKLRPMRIDAGWSEWDFEVYPHAWTSLRIETVQEGEKACEGLFRVRYRLRPSGHARIACGVMLLTSVIVGHFGLTLGLIGVLAVLIGSTSLWWRALQLGRRVAGLIDEAVLGLGLLRCEVGPRTLPSGGVADVV